METSEELTEEQRKRIDANRLAALAKRRAIVESSSTKQDTWRLFKCRKLSPGGTAHLPKHPQNVEPRPDPKTVLPGNFRVRLEICAPDAFSATPLAMQGFPYPGEAECMRRLGDILSDVIPSHYTQHNGGGKACVYKLQEYHMVLKCLKASRGIGVEEVPWSTFNVVERLSHSFIAGRWMPCRPEYLCDEKVDELIGTLPKKLLDSLLPFQLDGIRFGLRRGGRCLIADDMGLGKTLQAIAIAYCFKNEGPILVVCPAVLRYSWAEELERWLPNCLPTDIHLVFGHQDNPANLTRRPGVVVISYKMLHRLQRYMLEQEWAVLIIDESHHVRCSKKTSEPREIRAVLEVATKVKHIVLLSGTPSVSRPGLLGKDKYEFARTYCDIKKVCGIQGKTFQYRDSAKTLKGQYGSIMKDFSRGIRLEELNVLLRQTVMVRRLKEHVLRELPPIRRQIIRLSLKKSDIDLAKAATGCSKSEELTSEQLGIAKLSGFREWLSIHPIIAGSDGTTDVDLNPACHKMIIFAHHHRVLDGLQEFLCEKGIKFVCIDGRVLAEDKQSAMVSFQSSTEVKVAIVGLTAGGVGINLSTASNVAILELPQNPMWLQQAESRAHRRGQIHGVNVYIFCAKDTQDESCWQRLNRSVHRVSSTTDGKYESKKEIVIEGVSYLDASREVGGLENQITEKAACAEVSAEIVEFSECLLPHSVPFQEPQCTLGNMSDKYEEPRTNSGSSVLMVDFHNEVRQASTDSKPNVHKNSDSKEELEENVSEVEMGNSGRVCSLTKDSGDSDQRMVAENDPDAPIQPIEANKSCLEQVDSLRFEVSKYTGRVHLYSCIAGADLRPRPLFASFQPQELELLRTTADGLSEECATYRHALLVFLSEWDKLRPIERRKLFGKPLQLPLTIELCYLNERVNHNNGGLLRGGSTRRTTPLHEISRPLPSGAEWRKVRLCSGCSKREKEYTQGWTLKDEPLCKLCQAPCKGNNAKKPEFFEDLFCNLQCFEEYRMRTSNRFLRQELFKIERGICTECKLDCHQLVQRLQHLSLEKRQEYVEKTAPKLAGRKRLLDKLVNDPTEGNAWHADHIVAVYQGGGECRLENMRTLCTACHADVTAVQCAERHDAKAKTRKLLKAVIKSLKDCQNTKGSDKNLKEKVPLEMKDDGVDELLIRVPGSAYSEGKATD